ncbi:hypothetical protein BKA70DRAFT_1099308 [Coprinopsis sp. MPI-PUGE-AT-0042]|nr:hypothetical protein BKA70DRAFT_1099308 [Coprinopsis sp. MPI-PUGE-AT-0042]
MESLRNKATKRQRKDSDAPVSAVTRSAKFWFEDGNLVLQVEQTQFRVHKSVLARHSPVFRDMSSFSQPPEEDEPMVEGCPIVYLSDSAQQWELLIGVLYDGLQFVPFSGQLLPFGLVAAMLQLGHKYQFDALKERALQCLSKQFPDKREGFYFTSGTPMRKAKPQTTCFLDVADSFNDVVNLAIRLRLHRILPSVYLQALMRASSLLPSFYTGTKSASGKITELSHQTQTLLSQSHGRLAIEVSENQLSWLRNGVIPAAECLAPVSCQTALFQWITGFWIPTVSLAKPFSSMNGAKLGGSFCAECKEIVRDHFENGKAATWRKLPEIFGLPPWEELKNFAFD